MSIEFWIFLSNVLLVAVTLILIAIMARDSYKHQEVLDDNDKQIEKALIHVIRKEVEGGRPEDDDAK